MHNLFFLGIILVGKEKFKTKRQNPKKLKASHFAVETVGRSTGVSWLSRGEGKRDPRTSLQGCFRKNHKRKRKRLAGVQTSASSEKGKGVGCISDIFLQLRTQKNKN